MTKYSFCNLKFCIFHTGVACLLQFWSKVVIFTLFNILYCVKQLLKSILRTKGSLTLYFNNSWWLSTIQTRYLNLKGANISSLIFDNETGILLGPCYQSVRKVFTGNLYHVYVTSMYRIWVTIFGVLKINVWCIYKLEYGKIGSLNLPHLVYSFIIHD